MDSTIAHDLQTWCEDYINRKIKHFAVAKHRNIIGLHQTLLYKDAAAQLLHQEIIQFIQEKDVFHVAHRDFTTFICRKTIFDLNLNPIIPSEAQ